MKTLKSLTSLALDAFEAAAVGVSKLLCMGVSLSESERQNAGADALYDETRDLARTVTENNPQPIRLAALSADDLSSLAWVARKYAETQPFESAKTYWIDLAGRVNAHRDSAVAVSVLNRAPVQA